MFKHIFILIFILILCYFIIKYIKYIINLNYKLFTDTDIIKYPLNQYDKDYLNKYSKKMSINDVKDHYFYTKRKWSTKNCNYILFKERYYIVEPDYYYVLNDNCKLFFNKNKYVFALKIK